RCRTARPAIEACCAQDVQHGRRDRRQTLALHTHSMGPSSADGRAAANATLGTLKRLPVHSVSIRDLPRNPAGKIDRMALRRQLSAAVADNVAGVRHDAFAR
ncbi:MAG: hypothetical protein ABI294_09455, partial [Casimicrobiaceae bacterium]